MRVALELVGVVVEPRCIAIDRKPFELREIVSELGRKYFTPVCKKVADIRGSVN